MVIWTRKVKKSVLQLFKNVMNNDDVCSTIISHLTLGDAIALKEALNLVMGHRARRQTRGSVSEKNPKARLWMNAMANFDTSILQDKRKTGL